MDKKTILDILQKFLKDNPNFKPTNDGLTLSDPIEHTINGNIVYYVFWNYEGRTLRGGPTYYIFPNGAILMPRGGSGQPETLEEVYSRWENQK
jgi:hypothetical protein